MNRLFIKKPWISEKSTGLSSDRKYVFLVDPRANKNQVRDLIGDIYNVNVKKVNIIRVRNKSNNFKKAIVTLADGESIDIVPQS